MKTVLNHLFRIFILAVIALITACGPSMINLTVIPQLEGTGLDMYCPPLCMEYESVRSPDKPDQPFTGPIKFNLSSSWTKDIEVEAFKSIKVPYEFNITAFDEKNADVNFFTYEEDRAILFSKWGDGSTENPHKFNFSGRDAKLYAYYGLYKKIGTQYTTIPTVSSKHALDMGCKDIINELLIKYLSWAPVITSGMSFDLLLELYNAVEYPFPPNWVPVTTSKMSYDLWGECIKTETAVGDYWFSHYSQDVCVWVELYGENRTKYLSHATDGTLGSPPDQIILEWERGSYPIWAWPRSDRAKEFPNQDRVWSRGKWCYDCGHLSNEYDEGTWSEFHPPICVAAIRGTQGKGKIFPKAAIQEYIQDINPEAVALMGGVQVDVWMNGDPGKALETIKCINGIFDDPECRKPFPIDSLYEFEFPMPAKPGIEYAPSKSKFRVGLARLQPGEPIPVVQLTTDPQTLDTILKVSIDLRGYPDVYNNCTNEKLTNCRGDTYAVTILAGWEVFKYPEDIHFLEIVIDSIRIFDSREGEGGPGEFKLVLSLGNMSMDDPIKKPNTLDLHELNTGLLSAAGHGEKYALKEDGMPLTRRLIAWESDEYNDRISLQVYGIEWDDLENDNAGNLNRLWYKDKTEYEIAPVSFYLIPPVNNEYWGYPKWSKCDKNKNEPQDDCYYGFEMSFGTVRGGSHQHPAQQNNEALLYEDPVIGEGDLTYSLIYSIREIKINE